MNQKINRKNFIWLFYLGAFLLLASTLALFQPAEDPLTTPGLMPPDEHFRYLIPKYIYTHGALPTGLEEEVRIVGCGFSYGLYNVLPYIVMAGVMKLVSLVTVSDIALLMAARFTNVAIGLVMAILVAKLAGRLFSQERYRWLMACAITFLPENLFVHTYVNTDSASLLSVAMMLLALVWAYQEGFGVRNSLLLAGGVIICTLSYYNTYGFILGSILLFIAYFVVRRDGKITFDFKPFLKYGIFICVVVLLGIGWWYVHTYQVLDGDILGLRTKRELAILYAFPEVHPYHTYQARGYSIAGMFAEHPDFLECLYDSFIATYGTLSIQGTWLIYFTYKVFFAAGTLGLIAGMIGNRKKRSGRELFFHAVMVLCMIIPFVILVIYCYTADFQHQGRYVLSITLPLMYYMVSGIRSLAQMRIRGKEFPKPLVWCGLAVAYVIVIEGAFNMVYLQALPRYLELAAMLNG